LSSQFVTINGKEYIVSIEESGSVRVNNVKINTDVQQLDERSFSFLADAVSAKVVADRISEGFLILVNGRQYEATVETERARLLKKFDSQSSTHTKKTEIRAPMPALVVRLEVEVGDQVKAGQGLIILEAMKMENEIKAHGGGKVKEIYASTRKAVEKGELLMVLE
jgi:biotin carboxyl carrier protein